MKLQKAISLERVNIDTWLLHFANFDDLSNRQTGF